MSKYVLAIDQGTTSSRAILFTKELAIEAVAQEEFPQIYPRSGWVEHDPEDLWRTTLSTCRKVLEQAKAEATDIVAIGITNQRETTVIWDKTTGKPLHNAIVWQDRRTSDLCATLKAEGVENTFTEKTGLLLDPYFSGTKIKWLLDNVDGARNSAQSGNLAFGTIDTFLLWRLTGGTVHATDATNASRTLIYDIRQGVFDSTLLDILDIPKELLPKVLDCATDFGSTDPQLFGAPIPITGIAGDQQAATVGQACFEPGMLKSTYGTGCFAVMNTGATPVHSQNRLLTTIAYQLGGKPTYALEGSIFVAGAAVQWLRDGLGIIENASDTGSLATAADPHQDVYLVPAFVGLGAPHWDAEARGALFGLTRATGPKELARAALESVCYQTSELLSAMKNDWPTDQDVVLRVDGGMVASNWTMQFLADILDVPVDRPSILETTALGAAYLAGMHVGFYPSPGEFSENWLLEKRFNPQMPEADRSRKLSGWHEAVRRTLTS